jgi:TrmH family RNA methyltransferase
MELSRRQEALIRSLFTRHGRKKHQLCVCEGKRCCQEILEHSPELIEFIVCDHEFEDISVPAKDLYRVTSEQLKSLSATVNSQGILMVVRKPELLTPEQAPEAVFIPVLDQISDPGNFGTILRTVKATGLKELWYTNGSVDPFNDKVIRSAMGAQFSVGLREFEDLNSLAEFLTTSGYSRIYRTDPHTGANCFTESKLFEHSAIILGSEAHGAGELANSQPLTIPMPGNAESLNVAQAATIILFEYVRRLSI